MLAEICPICEGVSWRFDAEENMYRCSQCSPGNSLVEDPPVASAVEKKTEEVLPPVEAASPEIISKCLLTHLRPWCDRCGGWQGIETAWDDGRVDLQCRTCRANLPDQPSLEWEPKESHKLTVAAT